MKAPEGEKRCEHAPRSVIMTNHGNVAYLKIATADTAEVPIQPYRKPEFTTSLHDGYLRHGNSMWSLRYSDSQVQMSFMPLTIVSIRPSQLQFEHTDCSKLFDRMLQISPK